MRKQPVFATSMWSAVLRICCITAVLLTLGACGSSGGGDGGTGSGSGGGSGSGSGGNGGGSSGSGDGDGDGDGDGSNDDGGGTGSAPAIQFMAADDGVNGMELWKTDGTPEGTVLVKDINNSTASAASSPFDFTELNGVFYFQANDGVHGRELWKTDGTPESTVLVKDINTSPGESAFSYGLYRFTVFNGALYFVADDGVNGAELWKTDGTASGTMQVKDINTAAGVASFPAGLTVFNDALYFGANDGVNGVELWKTDGSADGTVLVKNINPATDTGAASFPTGFTVFKGALYFQAYDGVTGFELWKTDGTADGTVLVKDIRTEAGSDSDSNPSGFTEFNDALYFTANDGGHGQQLWKTDGTPTGTARVTEINNVTPMSTTSHLYGLIIFNGGLYFGAYDAQGYELWKTDGSAGGTVRLTDINDTKGQHPHYPYGFIIFNDALYFRNDNHVTNYELWKTDGTTAGTVLVKNINATAAPVKMPGVAVSNHRVFTGLNGALYFQADDGVHGSELWKTDGTETGTQLVKDVCPGICPGYLD